MENKDLEIIKSVFDNMTWPFSECAEIELGQAREIIVAASRMAARIEDLEKEKEQWLKSINENATIMVNQEAAMSAKDKEIERLNHIIYPTT